MQVPGAHEEPCADRSVMQEQLQASEVAPPVAAPVIVSVATPLVVGQTSSVLADCHAPSGCYLGPTAGPRRLRSVVLRI